MLTNPILADRHDRLPAWIRAFIAAGYGPSTVANLFGVGVHDVRLILKGVA